MSNFTLRSLQLANVNEAPYISLGTTTGQFGISNSHISKLLVPFVTSSVPKFSFVAQRSLFFRSLDSPLRFDTRDVYRVITNVREGFSSDYSVNITEVAFVGCTSKHEGGAIFAIVPNNVLINTSSFSDCSSRRGGAIYSICSNITIVSCCAMNCSAGRGGFAFVPYTDEDFIMNNTHVHDSKKTALEISTCVTFIDGCNISGSNDALVYEASVDSFVTGITFVGNDAISSIASFFQCNSAHEIEGLIFYNNKAAESILKFTGLSMTLNECVFITNTYKNLCTSESEEQIITLANATFSESKEVVDVAPLKLLDCKYGETTIEMVPMETYQCWHLSTYIWKDPPLVVEIIVVVFIALVAIGFIVGFVVKTQVEKKKKAERNAAGVEMSDFNRLFDTNNRSASMQSIETE